MQYSQISHYIINPFPEVSLAESKSAPPIFSAKSA